MKLSKTVWLVIVIVLLGIAAGVLFSIYSGQVGERGDLSDRVSNAQTLLPGLVANREKLEDQLAQAESSLDKSQAKFPESVKSIEYGEDLFEIADDCNVDLTSLRPSMPTSKKVGAVTYSVSPFVVVVKGNIDNILDFIYVIRTGGDFQLPWSADLKGVNMGGSQASITLDIYGYKR
jgi:hypothetical protein